MIGSRQPSKSLLSDLQIAPRVDRTRLLRRYLGRRPGALPILKAWKSFRSDEIVSRSSDFCVEGFPFSANTFAYCAVLDGNPGLVGGHHTHMEGQVLRAAQLGIPTALVIRDPRDAVESLAVFDGGQAAARHFVPLWADYHRRLSTLIEEGGVVVCPFDRVVADPSFTVGAINARFGTDLAIPVSSSEEISRRAREMRISRGVASRATYEDSSSESLDDLGRAIRSHPDTPRAVETYEWVLGFAPDEEELVTSS